MAAVSVSEQHDVVVLGAGVAGIYQIKCLLDLGIDAIVLEADEDLGGTWYRNRYPGCRFDSESYTYGYSFSRELLDEWHWNERFSSQPENLRYLNFVADKFNLRPHMRFGQRVAAMTWHDEHQQWELAMIDGSTYRARVVISGVGVLSIPTLPTYPGMDDFRGDSFHTFHWPKEPLDLADKRVGVIGTGATGIQVISEVAKTAQHLTVFQRRPNWSTPLNNAPISADEMADIRQRYDEIFAACDSSPNGFEHLPDRRGFWNLTPEERHATWDELYASPGFAMLAANFVEIFRDVEANREVSEYVANRIRQRVDDPVVAEKLIPTDHGFGTQRLPLETRYFETYNQPNVALVDVSETPIEQITASGVTTSDGHVDLDVLVYATGFDAITGAYDRIAITGVGGQTLGEKWADTPRTYLGIMSAGFPNLFMLAGPQSVSGSTNFPRAIQNTVNWVSALVAHMNQGGYTRVEANLEAEESWVDEVMRQYGKMLQPRSKGWFAGYNSNIEGREAGTIRYQAYFGGAPKYDALLRDAATEGYPNLTFANRP